VEHLLNGKIFQDPWKNLSRWKYVVQKDCEPGRPLIDFWHKIIFLTVIWLRYILKSSIRTFEFLSFEFWDWQNLIYVFKSGCFEILLEFCFIILALNVYQSAQAAYKAKLFLSEITNFLLFPTWWYVKTTYIRGTKKKGSSYRKSVTLSKSTTYLGSHLSRLNIFFIQFSEVKLAYEI